MTAARAFSWFEMSSGCLLVLFAAWLLFDLRGAPPGVDEHGYLAMGAFAMLCLAFALVFAGALLRLTSRWRWLGQIPLAALLIAMYIFN